MGTRECSFRPGKCKEKLGATRGNVQAVGILLRPYVDTWYARVMTRYISTSYRLQISYDGTNWCEMRIPQGMSLQGLRDYKASMESERKPTEKRTYRILCTSESVVD